MLEIHSIRREWGSAEPRWYCLYRTKPGMWEELFLLVPTEEAARKRIEAMYAEGWIK